MPKTNTGTVLRFTGERLFRRSHPFTWKAGFTKHLSPTYRSKHTESMLKLSTYQLDDHVLESLDRNHKILVVLSSQDRWPTISNVSRASHPRTWRTRQKPYKSLINSSKLVVLQKIFTEHSSLWLNVHTSSNDHRLLLTTHCKFCRIDTRIPTGVLVTRSIWGRSRNTGWSSWMGQSIWKQTRTRHIRCVWPNLVMVRLIAAQSEAMLKNYNLRSEVATQGQPNQRNPTGTWRTVRQWSRRWILHQTIAQKVRRYFASDAKCTTLCVTTWSTTYASPTWTPWKRYWAKGVGWQVDCHLWRRLRRMGNTYDG